MKKTLCSQITKFAILGALTCGSAASLQAASLESYFDFTQYGSVSGGSQITSNVYGNASATVSSTATTLNSSGLAITAGTNAGSTGVTLAGSQLASFTGDFSFQIWFTSPSTIDTNTALFGGTTSAPLDSNMIGDQALFVAYSNTSPLFLRQIMSNNTKFGIDAASTPRRTATTPSTLYDYTITYTANTHTVQAYLDGTAVGSGLSVNFFNGLSALTNGFSIGGVASPAFADDAAAVTVSSSLFYDGALTPTEIADIHAFGSNATVDELGTVVTIPESKPVSIPEPATDALLFGATALTCVAFRRRKA